MGITDVHVLDFDEKVLNSDKKTVVDFWAAWCGPCRILSPIVDEVANEHTDVQFCKVNVDEERDLAIRYGIMSIPTLLVFDKGELVNKSIGLISKEKIEDLIG